MREHILPIECPYMDGGDCAKREGQYCHREICDEPARGWGSPSHQALIEYNSAERARIVRSIEGRMSRVVSILRGGGSVSEWALVDLRHLDRALAAFDPGQHSDL
jgi:hypothetical protein